MTVTVGGILSTGSPKVHPSSGTLSPTRPHTLIVLLPMLSSFFQTTAGPDSRPDPFLFLRDERRGKNNIEVMPGEAIGLGEEPECADEVRRLTRERTKMFFLPERDQP